MGHHGKIITYYSVMLYTFSVKVSGLQLNGFCRSYLFWFVYYVGKIKKQVRIAEIKKIKWILLYFSVIVKVIRGLGIICFQMKALLDIIILRFSCLVKFSTTFYCNHLNKCFRPRLIDGLINSRSLFTYAVWELRAIFNECTASLCNWCIER